MGGAQSYAGRFKPGGVDGRPKPGQRNGVCVFDDEWLRGFAEKGSKSRGLNIGV